MHHFAWETTATVGIDDLAEVTNELHELMHAQILLIDLATNGATRNADSVMPEVRTGAFRQYIEGIDITSIMAPSFAVSIASHPESKAFVETALVTSLCETGCHATIRLRSLGSLPDREGQSAIRAAVFELFAVIPGMLRVVDSIDTATSSAAPIDYLRIETLEAAVACSEMPSEYPRLLVLSSSWREIDHSPAAMFPMMIVTTSSRDLFNTIAGAKTDAQFALCQPGSSRWLLPAAPDDKSIKSLIQFLFEHARDIVRQGLPSLDSPPPRMSSVFNLIPGSPGQGFCNSGPGDEVEELEDQIAELEEQVSELEEERDSLMGRVERLSDTVIRSMETTSALYSAVGRLEKKVASLQKSSSAKKGEKA